VPTYFVLGRFTKEGVDKLVKGETAHVADLIGPVVRATRHDAWLTTGAYDVVIVLEVENSRDAIAFAAAYASIAGAETTTLAANADVDDIVRAATEAHTRHEGRGGDGPPSDVGPGDHGGAGGDDDAAHTRHVGRPDIG
jgi:uncharacterized protein with GYD domain